MGKDDVFALKVKQNLGGGLAAYGEYGNVDGDVTNREVYTVGMSYSF
jgi:hypothetical protein